MKTTLIAAFFLLTSCNLQVVREQTMDPQITPSAAQAPILVQVEPTLWWTWRDEILAAAEAWNDAAECSVVVVQGTSDAPHDVQVEWGSATSEVNARYDWLDHKVYLDRVSGSTEAYIAFTHEFGHMLGLGHDGYDPMVRPIIPPDPKTCPDGWPRCSPLYRRPSIMHGHALAYAAEPAFWPVITDVDADAVRKRWCR